MKKNPFKKSVHGKRKPNWKLWLKDKKECKIWLDIYSNRKKTLTGFIL